MSKQVYILSRIWNRFTLSIALFFIRRTWDLTKRNKDIIQDAKYYTKECRDYLGTR